MPVSTATDADALDPKMLLSVLARVKAGDFTARMPLEWTGVAGKVADGLNDVIIANQALEAELARVSEVVGEQGRLSQRVVLGGSAQSWSGSVESVNNLIEALVRPTSEMQRVIGAVADGDLSKKVSADVQGEMLELKNTINAMVDQLNGFVSELTRVAREVGTEGKLGQAAAVTIEVGGVWKDLTDNVNLMAGNLTGQVRNIAEVTTAVANGDLSKKISIDVKGEFLELKNTVNAMVDQLNAFAGEVTRVAREVGVEGKLGGQAQSKEVAGVWKDLTDNVNQLAANLTNQVRAIAEVATAVTEGDLTRQVSSGGERGGGRPEGHAQRDDPQPPRDDPAERRAGLVEDQPGALHPHAPGPATTSATVSNMILSELAPLVSAQHGVFYSMTSPTDGSEAVSGAPGRLRLRGATPAVDLLPARAKASSASAPRRRSGSCSPRFPATTSGSTRGSAPPLRSNIIVLPVLFEGIRARGGRARVVLRLLASPTRRSSTQLTESIGLVLNTIEANTLTENLLKQSQSLAEELRSQQEELRESNEDLGAPSHAPGRAEHRGANRRTRRSSSRSASSRRRPANWPSRRSTSPSSSPTCPTSCARRSTAC